MRQRSCIHSHLDKALQRASPLRLPPLHSTLRGSLACYLVSDLASLWNLGQLCWSPLECEHALVHPLKVRHIITVRVIESLWSCQPHLAMHHRRPLLLLCQPQKGDGCLAPGKGYKSCLYFKRETFLIALLSRNMWSPSENPLTSQAHKDIMCRQGNGMVTCGLCKGPWVPEG